MGLRLKLGVYVAFFVCALLVLVVVLPARWERHRMLQQFERRAETLLRSFSIPCATAMANNDLTSLDNYVEQFSEAARSIDLAYMAVLDFQGRVVAHTTQNEYGRIYDDAFTSAVLRGSERESRMGKQGEEDILEIAVPVESGLRWGLLRAGFSFRDIELQITRRRTQLVLLGIALGTGVALVSFWVLSVLVIRPVLRMRRMARAFGAGTLDARVVLEQKDEMGELATQLNNMAGQIQQYTDSLEQEVNSRTAELGEANQKLLLANRQLERMASTDALTGLFNRRHFMQQLQFEIRRGQRNPHHFALIMMDVDHFKNFNDTNGHSAGDELLQRLAALLEINLRSTDLVARYGGEEFIILLLDTGREEGYRTACKLRQVVAAQPFPHEEKQPGGVLSVSVGVSFYPDDSKDARDLIEKADQALYYSKAAGRDRVSRYAEVERQRL